MSIIEVKVCLGTTCFNEGKNNLNKLSEIIPKRYGNKVEVVPCNCLGLCSINWENSKAPYAKVDDEIIKQATPEKILDAIDRKLAQSKIKNSALTA